MSEEKSQSKKVRIVGAGFSGLTLAYYLVKSGHEVEIFEKSSRVGGLIGTLNLPSQPSSTTCGSTQEPAMRVETAANAFLWSEELADVCEDIGCSLEKTLPAAKRRYIFWKRKTRWPLGFFESLVFVGFILRLIFAKKTLAPRPNETVSEWGTRNLGEAHVQKLIAPALQGIYAGDPARMSASLILKMIFNPGSKKSDAASNSTNGVATKDLSAKPARKRQFGSHSPNTGMQEFVDKLEAFLLSKNVKIQKNSEVRLSELQANFAGRVVIATNPKQMTELVRSEYPELAKCFDQIEMLNLARVTVGLENPSSTLDGFGVLFTKESGYRVLGVLSNSETFRNRGRLHNESWIFGGAKDTHFLDQSDAVIAEQISKERGRLFSAQDPLSLVQVVRWPEALVHYDLNLESALAQYKTIERNLNQRGLWLTGNYLGSIGLSRMLKFNKELAERMGT